MFSWFTKKNKAPKENLKAVEEKIKKEANQREKQRLQNEALRKALYNAEHKLVEIENNNIGYASKKGILKNFQLRPISFQSLKMPKYMEFQQKLQNLRKENRVQAQKERNEEDERERVRNEELQQELAEERASMGSRGTSITSDPRSRSPSPFRGGRRTRKQKRKSRKQRKH